MKRLFLFLFLFTSLLKADSLVRTIKELRYEFDSAHSQVLISLSDGSVWHWYPELYTETLLSNWEKGDEVTIHASQHAGFVLHNLSKTHYTPRVALDYECCTLFPTIEKIERDGFILELSDGSRWELVYDFSRKSFLHWQEGDRVIPVKGNLENFELINLNIPYDSRPFIERALQVEQIKPTLSKKEKQTS